MFATTLSTTTSALTVRASRVRALGAGRLAPTGEDLEERSNWKIKTRWILGAWAVLSAVSALGTALTPALLAFPMVLVAFTPRLPFLILAAAIGQPGAVLLRRPSPDARRRSDPHRPRPPLRRALRAAAGTRLMVRLGLVGVALRPTSKVLAAAGACKLRTSRVLIADVLGTVGLLASVYVGTSTVVG